ncbi:hypothetical protein [Nocardioides plantarum]|uniref:Alpha/beta hydrolase n=1 Tax=Nocardioides plantarum TaxID=29299 RepID=A0ABV5KDY5_9ACTN|nr:hypothetical protein [Nocardioides plantarum]
MTSDPGSAPTATALLICPIPYDSRIWGRFATVLGEHMRVVEVEWPRPEGAIFEMTSTIDHVVDRSGVAEFDVVVAAGLDAAAAVHLAVRGAVRAVALIDPSPGQEMPEVPFPDLDARLAGVFADNEDLLEALAERDAEALARLLASQSGAGLSPANRRLVHDVFLDNVDTVFDAVRGAASGTWWPDLLGSLEQPVLAFARTSPQTDLALHHAMVEALVARCAHGALVMVDSASELPWLAQPDLMAAAIVALGSPTTRP